MPCKNMIILAALATTLATSVLSMLNNENLAVTPKCSKHEDAIRALLFPYEGCGICQEIGEEISCVTHGSQYANINYNNLMHNAEKDILGHIDALFEQSKRASPLIEIRNAVQEACHNQGGLTIKDYCDNYGENELKKLFDTVGLQALEHFLYKKVKWAALEILRQRTNKNH